MGRLFVQVVGLELVGPCSVRLGGGGGGGVVVADGKLWFGDEDQVGD